MPHEYKAVNTETRVMYNDEMPSLRAKHSFGEGSDEVQEKQAAIASTAYSLEGNQLPARPAPLPKESLFRGIRHHLRLSLWGLAMSSASIMTGYEEVFTGAISEVPAFVASYSNTTTLDAMWIALWAISHPLGASLGSGFGGWTLDKIGRRYTLAIATAWLVFTPFVSFFSDRLSTVLARALLYFVGKFLQGIGVGATITVLLAYTSEILPPSIKGSILALHVPMTLLGNLFGAVALKKAAKGAGPNAYRLPMAGQWILLIIPVLLLIFLPESPVWCIRQNRLSQAKAGCRKLQGPVRHPTDDMYPRLLEVVAGQEKGKAHMEVIKWSELFRGKSDRHRTFVVVFTATIPLFLGVPFLSHAGYVGELMGMDASLASTFFLAGSVVAVIGSVIAFFIVPAIGRRPNVIFSSIIITVLWLSTGIAGSFLGKSGPPAHLQMPNGTFVLTTNGNPVEILNRNDQIVTKYIGCGVIMAAFFLSVFVWPVSFAISGETSSIRLRAKSLALRGISENITSCIISVALPYLYNPDAANIPSKIGFIFFGLGIIVIAVSWVSIPETKGLDSVEIDALYERKRL